MFVIWEQITNRRVRFKLVGYTLFFPILVLNHSHFTLRVANLPKWTLTNLKTPTRTVKSSKRNSSKQSVPLALHFRLKLPKRWSHLKPDLSNILESRLNDGTRTYVEANTLLEPANNSSAMQHDIEEIREVSTQLSSIKKKHDETKRVCIKKQEELDAIREEIKNLSIQETVAEGPAYAVANRLEQLTLQHAECLEKIDEENLTAATYRYMLDRLEKDFIATKIKSTELDTSIKSKKGILDLEGGKQRKTKEERLQAKAIFDNLMKNIELEQKDRQERIFELQKCIQNKEASVSRRIERQRKNAEIAEAAANENKDSSELKMRENLYTQKLWNTYMRKRMEKEMRNSAQIDEAFKNIKTATQVTDVQEMVRKFLTREQTYSSLLKTVSESENKIDYLKKSNEELRAQLHELTLDSSNNG